MRNVHEKLLPYQYRLLQSRASYTGLVGGTGSGKTWFLPRWLLARISEYPGHEWIVSSPIYASIISLIWPALTGYLDRLGIVYDASQSKMLIKVDHGSTQGNIHLISAEKPDRMQGIHAKGIVGDEAGMYDRKWWLTAVQRVGLSKGQILILTTPYFAGNWLKTDFIDRWLAGDPDYVIERPTTADNPFYPQEEIELAKQTLPDWRFRMMYMGEFTRPEGIVYPDVTYVPRFDIPANWQRIRGLDFGFNNPTAIVNLAKDPESGVWYVYQEFKQSGVLTDHLAQVLNGQEQSSGQLTYCDPAGKTQIATLQAHGVNAIPASNPVLPGILYITSMLRTGKLRVFDELRLIRDEFQSYRWRRDRSGTELDEVVKENDHLLDALRYAVYTYGASARVKPRPEPDVHFDF